MKEYQTPEKLNIDKKIVVFIGPEGSGKTTISKMLADETGMLYLSTGGIIRYLAEKDQGEWGDACRAILEQHIYVDGETFLKILADRFKREDTKNGFVLDGGLRTMIETEGFQDILEETGRVLPVIVVHLEIPEEVSLERLVTGENARKRNDDTYEGVLRRLSEYMNNFEDRLRIIDTSPNWKLIHIDANMPINEVFEAVCTSLLEAE